MIQSGPEKVEPTQHGAFGGTSDGDAVTDKVGEGEGEGVGDGSGAEHDVVAPTADQLPAGQGSTSYPPSKEKSPPAPVIIGVPATKFIVGEPMKPAT